MGEKKKVLYNGTLIATASFEVQLATVPLSWKPLPCAHGPSSNQQEPETDQFIIIFYIRTKVPRHQRYWQAVNRKQN